MKICTKCRIEKPVTEFRKSKAYKTGLRPRCRLCQNEDDRERFHRNKETAKAKTKRAYAQAKDRLKAERDAFRAANPVRKGGALRRLTDEQRYENKLLSRKKTYQKNKESVLATSALYRANHKEEERLNRRLHYERNKERSYQTTKAWQDANRDKCNFYAAKRRTAKIRAQPAWANEEKMAEIYAAAAWMSENSGEQWHVDHIVPLQSRRVCGLHCEANLTILPALENLSKSNRYWPDMFD